MFYFPLVSRQRATLLHRLGKHGAIFCVSSPKITTIVKQSSYCDMRGLIYILEVPLSCNMQILVKLMEWGLTKYCKQCFEKHFS